MIPYAVAQSAFAGAYSGAATIFSYAPGRINLIGEHVDYAGGRVLPVALSCGVTVAAAPGQAGRIRVHSDQYMSEGVLDASAASKVSPGCAAFVNAIALETGATGADLAVVSDLPLGRGWSSSAAFAVAVASALLALEPMPVQPSPLALCLLCQRAETRALGVACGLMDQYASVFGRRDAAVLLDTARLSHEYIPLNLPHACLVVIDSGQPRRLAESGYNQRRSELNQALEALRQLLGGFTNFREVDPEALLTAVQELPPLLSRRMRHLITEDQRVWRCVELLRAGAVVELGRMLTASHNSLSGDYEVSTPELDLLCQELDAEAGVYGSRLVGGGFGGSVLSLAHSTAVPERIEQALRSYQQQTKLHTTYDIVEAGDGAEVKLSAAAEPLAVTAWLGGSKQ